MNGSVSSLDCILEAVAERAPKNTLAPRYRRTKQKLQVVCTELEFLFPPSPPGSLLVLSTTPDVTLTVFNEAVGLLSGHNSACEGFSRPQRKHSGVTISAKRQKSAFGCGRQLSYLEQCDGHDHKHTLYGSVFSSEDEVEELDGTSPQTCVTTRCRETDAFPGVSSIFTFLSSESREEHTYQEVPCSHSLTSPPSRPPPHKLLYLPSSPSHCPSSPSPPPPTAIISGRQRVELEKRLDGLQRQITRLESCMSADIRTIMQLLQRQTPVIPPSYSTLTSSPNATSSPILSPTVPSPSGAPIPVFPTDESPSGPNENQDKVL
ncbi:unnamed protein product [Pleuronectes platessa]|uniref:Uncharacterized protein n=1 Tax=Pleuronectes platessa TaxID=8262 RepID=A0A9N7YRU6_PLEPL|nr:unnamed protein product [Pleuronectes platessa]